MATVMPGITEVADHDPFPLPTNRPAPTVSSPAHLRASPALPGAIAGASSRPATHLTPLVLVFGQRVPSRQAALAETREPGVSHRLGPVRTGRQVSNPKIGKDAWRFDQRDWATG